MDPYDVYFVHAWEDRKVAGEIVDSLRKRGLRVWFNSFRPGQRLRKQMEDGLKQSSFGAVLVTTTVFTKKWAVEELDALYSLESLDEGKIIPIWYGVTYDQVRSASPMLSSRSAILHETVADTVDQLMEVVLEATLSSSPAQWLRSRVAGGFPWVSGPAWCRDSLRLYDERASEYLHPVLGRIANAGDEMPRLVPPDREISPVFMPEFLRAALAWDGREVVVIGHQVRESTQVAEKIFEIPETTVGGVSVKVVSYVFQMQSRHLPDDQFVYVQVIGPYAEDWGPWALEGELTWAVGMPIALGQVPMASGGVGLCVYLAARAIVFMPQIQSDDHTDGTE